MTRIISPGMGAGIGRGSTEQTSPIPVAKAKAQVTHGVCIRCALPFPDEVYAAAPIERMVDAQWMGFRLDQGPPPDMPCVYTEPGSVTGHDIYPEGDPLHYTSYQPTVWDWDV